MQFIKPMFFSDQVEGDVFLLSLGKRTTSILSVFSLIAWVIYELAQKDILKDDIAFYNIIILK